MPRFRSKPIEIEAEQFLENRPLPFTDRGPIVAWDGYYFYVTTIHNQKVKLEYKDWVILEPRGINQAYPCKPDIFENRYEEIV